jgi:hypothetical protein
MDDAALWWRFVHARSNLTPNTGADLPTALPGSLQEQQGQPTPATASTPTTEGNVERGCQALHQHARHACHVIPAGSVLPCRPAMGWPGRVLIVWLAITHPAQHAAPAAESAGRQAADGYAQYGGPTPIRGRHGAYRNAVEVDNRNPCQIPASW